MNAHSDSETPAEDWPLVERLFDEALQVPADEREAWLKERVGDRPEIEREVARLLCADAAADGFLEEPPTAVLGLRTPTPDTAAQAPTPPVLGPWHLLHKLGEGGFSTVYLAERRDAYRQRVAIKVLRIGLQDEDLRARFRRERQILAGLDHPGIARILDGGETPEGAPYLVMEVVEGTSIDRYCQEHGLGVRETIHLFLKVLDAIEHAHRNLVVHRDLKPGNVLVRADGEPRLVDFGIAKLLNADLVGSIDPTRADLLMLTPRYASPEQITGSPISTSSDLYSLGVLLYRLLTGELPYDEATTESVESLVTAICRDDPIPASRKLREELPERARELKGDLDAILSRALAKRPEDRYRTVDRFADDLRRFLDGRPVHAQPPRLGDRLHKFVRRHRIAVTLATLLAALAFLSATSFVLQSRRTQAALDVAERERSTSQAVQKFLQEILVSADPMQGEGTSTTVLQAMRAAEETIDTSFREQPEVEAEIRSIIGTTYFQLGIYDDARRMQERTLDLLRQPPIDPQKLTAALGDLTRVLRRQGLLEEAESSAQEALSWLDQMKNPSPEVEAYLRLELGTLHRTRWRLEEAERELRTARRLYLEHPEIGQGWEAAGALQNLAAVQGMQGRYPEAAENLHRVQQELEQVHGPGHGSMVTVLYNLGFLNLLIGEYEASAESFTGAIETGERRYGSRSSQKVAMAVTGLAETRVALGRPEEALAHYDEALAVFESASGGSSALAADVLNARAVALLVLGEIVAADETARRAAAIVAGLSPPDPEEEAECDEIASEIALAAGDLEEAEVRARRGRDALEELLGENHHDTMVASVRLARVLLAQERPEEAGPLLDRAIDLLDHVTHPPARARRLAHLGRAEVLARQGRSEEARAILENDARMARLPPTDPVERQRRRAEAALETRAAAR